jgi:hypothetical protein
VGLGVGASDGDALDVGAGVADALGAGATVAAGEGVAAEATTHPLSNAAARIAAAHRVSVVDDTA